MRGLFALPFLLLFAGCPSPHGYHVNVTVTVPPEVQAQISPSNPGLLMVSRFVVAALCQPSDVPFSVPFEVWISAHTCERAGAAGYEELFVVRLSDSDVAWFSANLPSPLCGQSGPITDQKTIDAAMQRATSRNWGPQGNETIANGVGGDCDEAGNYTGAVVVNLLNPLASVRLTP